MTNDAAIDHFSRKLQFEADPSDVHAALERGDEFAFVDSRGDASWAQGRAAGAIHLPTAMIATTATARIPITTPVVVYCWGPGCNGSTKAALEFARLGYSVREMIGGFEYWAREGLDVMDDSGHLHRETDALTAPIASGISCDC